MLDNQSKIGEILGEFTDRHPNNALGNAKCTCQYKDPRSDIIYKYLTKEIKDKWDKTIFFRTLQDQLTDCCKACSQDGVINEVNKGARQLQGNTFKNWAVEKHGILAFVSGVDVHERQRIRIKICK